MLIFPHIMRIIEHGFRSTHCLLVVHDAPAFDGQCGLFGGRGPKSAWRQSRRFARRGRTPAAQEASGQPPARILRHRPAPVPLMGGTTPPWYIDDLMRHEGRPYYVG